MRYEELADAINGLGQPEVVAFFKQQAVFSRRHLQQAQRRIGTNEPWDGVEEDEDPDPSIVAFPGDESPEGADIWVADGHLSLDQAMAVALEAEERGHAYYAGVATSTPDPQVRVLAEHFAQEEAEHVAALKELIARLIKV